MLLVILLLSACLFPSTASDTGPAPCADVPEDRRHDDLVRRWATQDDAAPPPKGQIVVVGSSSIRRWESAARTFAPWGMVQRGFGGSVLSEVIGYLDTLVLRHEPSAVVVFSGTNDVAEGDDVNTVVTAWRCLVERLDEAKALPLVWIPITPTPARWRAWSVADAVNTQVARDAEGIPDLFIADPVPQFLATGQPPQDALFAEDGLHLSEAGYALWDRVVGDTVRALGLSERSAPAGPPSDTTITLDLTTWPTSSRTVVAGEALRSLPDSDGLPSRVDFVVSGGFLRTPEGLATTDGNVPGAFVLTGLSPSASHTLRLHGGPHTTAVLYGASKEPPLTGKTMVFDEIKPNRFGEFHVDIRRSHEGLGQLSRVELVVNEGATP
ncbi:MAG: GDSL-type esterase/lipase family protein [Myxococcota bacterium]